MKEVEETETDWKNRRPKDEHWLGIKDVVDSLSGRPSMPHPDAPLEGWQAKDAKRGLQV